MSERELLSRRAVLRHAAALSGGVLSAPLVASILAGCRPADKADAVPLAALSPEQYALVAEIAEQIIPQTQTPGARAANVPGFIDQLLAGWYSGDECAVFLQGLAQFERRCMREHATPFQSLVPAQQLAFLEVLDREAIEARQNAMDAAVGSGNVSLPFFAMIKEMTIVGYYTSEAGMAAIGYAGPMHAQFGELGPDAGGIWN